MRGNFEGWYYKHHTYDHTLALIPGRAGDGAFIQVVTRNKAYNIRYPLSEYHRDDVLRVGGSVFASSGVTLDIHSPELALTGRIRYAHLSPIRGDIMGPFRFFPMECRHGIVSMKHDLSGSVVLNGQTIGFDGGRGYIESDSGRSFPEGYAWVQCNDFERDGSIVASVARIPFCGRRFWGCICVVQVDGREVRLATYRGAKILRCVPGSIDLRQGKLRLTVTIDAQEGHALNAPKLGAMSRTIRESLSCPARFRLTSGDKVIFDGKSEHASYEHAMTTEDRI